jgi:hypothetical protein
MDLSYVPVCHLKTNRCSFEFELYNILDPCASVPPKKKELQLLIWAVQYSWVCASVPP